MTREYTPDAFDRIALNHDGRTYQGDNVRNLTDERLARLRERFMAFSGDIFGQAYDVEEAKAQLRSDALTMAHYMTSAEIGAFVANLGLEMATVSRKGRK